MPDKFPNFQGNDAALLAALAEIQQRGAIGEASLVAAISHADQFVDALPPTTRRLADLGSGGGLPGLVIAVRRPAIELTLVERRGNRADLLRRAVLSLRLEWVQVFGGDVRELADRQPHSFDVVTARSFAAPTITARWAGQLLAAEGILVVSEPPRQDSGRWPAKDLEAAGLSDLGRTGGIRRFQRA